MISVKQLASALYGIWLLLKLDARALEFFEKSPGGFARSFLPAVILSPLNFIHNILIYDPDHSRLALGPYLVVQVLSDVMSWVAFPFVMLYVTQLIHRAPRFLTYMVPYNWFQLPLGVVLLTVALLADIGAMPTDLAEYISLFILLVSFTFGAFIARIGLGIGLMAAIGIAVLDYVLSLFITQLIAQI